MVRYRFLYLFCALVFLLLIAPWAQTLRGDGGGSRGLVMAILFVTLMLAAVVAVGERGRTLVVAGVLASLPVFFQFCEAFLEPGDAAEGTTQFVRRASLWLTVAFLIYVIVPILRFLFLCRVVTFDTICAALCVYLLIGVIWAFVYSLFEVYYPDSFSSSGSEAFAIRTGEPLYFSFVTLTTLGYGDITPATPGARTLTMLEAIVGQFYLTVLVAWLVGLYISQSVRNAAR